MRNKTKNKKTHKKKSKSFKKKSKKNSKKNKRNDGMMLNDDILNNPYFNIGLALSGETENSSKCDCSKKEEEILRILDEIEEKLSKFK